jgi:hypothetical protein
MKPGPQPTGPIRARSAAFTSAGVVLIAAGFFVSNGWPLILGGFVLLFAAVSTQR